MDKQKREEAEQRREANARQIIARPDDEDFFNFLAEQFWISPSDAVGNKVKSEDDVFPERISLKVCYIRETREDYSDGEIISKSYKSMQAQALKTEDIVVLSNEFLAKAQADCTKAGRKRLYAVLVHSPRRGSQHYARHLLALKPGSRGADVLSAGGGFIGGGSSGGISGAEDDDVPSILSTKLLLGLLDSERRDKRWMMELNANLLSGVVERQDDRIERMESIVDGTWERQSKLMQATEEMLNQAAERKRLADHAAWKQAKIDFLIEKGLTMAQVLVPQLLAGQQMQVPGTNLIADFFRALTDAEATALFGNFDPSIGTVSGAIFTGQQFEQMMRLGQSPTPDKAVIDALAASITPEQIAAARSIVGDRVAPLLKLIAKTPTPPPRAFNNPVDAFIDSLSDAEGEALFGKYDATAKTVAGAIFSDEQFKLMCRIATQVNPDETDVRALVASVTQEQIARVQQAVNLARLIPLGQWLQQHAPGATA